MLHNNFIQSTGNSAFPFSLQVFVIRQMMISFYAILDDIKMEG
jgi:hypothetical protein